MHRILYIFHIRLYVYLNVCFNYIHAIYIHVHIYIDSLSRGGEIYFKLGDYEFVLLNYKHQTKDDYKIKLLWVIFAFENTQHLHN